MQKDSMISYQLPSDLSLDQFHGLVTDLYYQLRKNGLDPALNMVIGDHDEIFQVLVSEDAALILAQTYRWPSSLSIFSAAEHTHLQAVDSDSHQ